MEEFLIEREAKKAGLFDGPVSSCEAELQELMRQIDIMVKNRQAQWETDFDVVKGQLRSRDQELMSQRALLQSKHQEVGRLRHQLSSSEVEKQRLSSQYEQKLAQLRTQLTSLQRDYERVERHHSKQTVGAEREKNQANMQLKDIDTQLHKAQATIREHQNKANEWDIQKRAFEHQIESLEAQKKTFADKYQIIEQQSKSYQDQLTKRRHLLEQTELNFKSRLANLEGCLTRSQDTIEDKNATTQRLEEKLREIDGGRKNERGERRELEDRLRKTEGHLKHLKDENNQLNSELQSRDGLLADTEQTMKRHKQEKAKLEETIALKEDMIRSLKEENGQAVSVQLQELQARLDESERELERRLHAENQLQDDIHRLQTRLDDSHTECARLNTELATKIDELRRLEGTELQHLKEQLAKAKARSGQHEQRYLSHLNGMRSEVTALTSDLHHKDNTIATLSQKIAFLERKEREETQRTERHQHELRITSAQLDALRTENRSLRESCSISPDTSSTVQEIRKTEAQLQEFRNMHEKYNQSIRQLEEENSTLRRKLSSLTQQLLEAETSQDIKYQATIKESHQQIAEIKQEYERKLERLSEHQTHNAELLQSQLDTTMQRDEAEISRLRGRCQGLSHELKEKKHLLHRLQGEHSAMAGFVNNVEVIATSPARPSTRSSPHLSSSTTPPTSPHPSSTRSTPHTRRRSPAARKLFDGDYESEAMPEILGFPELVIPSADWDSKRSESRESITANFVAEDLRKTRDLEQLLDNHIASLEQQTDDAIQRRYRANHGSIEDDFT